jgi:hypothetical protein
MWRSSSLASSEHALDLIDKIVNEAACPVIALLHGPDPEFVLALRTVQDGSAGDAEMGRVRRNAAVSRG